MEDYAIYDYDEDIEFENFLAECVENAKNANEAIIKKWLDSIGYKEPIAYYKNYGDKTMEIYATKPGFLIGKAGVHVYELEKILSEEFFGEWKVKFIEIRGGFIIPQ